MHHEQYFISKKIIPEIFLKKWYETSAETKEDNKSKWIVYNSMA